MERPDLNEVIGCIRALADEGSAKSLRTVCLINRYLLQDWPNSLHDCFSSLLDDAEAAISTKDIDTEIL